MTRPLAAAAIGVLLVAAAVYFWKLGAAPIYLAPDEVIIANDALSLARTGHTLDGAFLPLYVFVEVSRAWFMPAIYYLQAIALQILPLAEASIRTPSVIVALATMILTMAVARRALGAQLSMVAAVIVLACAPAFFVLSRYALDYTYPLPLILAWLYCLLTALQQPKAIGWFVGAGLCLGIGWYTYISSMIMMPVYVAITIAAMLARRRSWSELAAFTASVAVPLMFFAMWAAHHPQAFQQTATRYNFIDPREKATALGILSSFDFVAMFNRYRNFFGIEFLFKLGDVYLPFSTRTVGVFVPAASVLMVIGALVAVTRRTLPQMLILAGFLTAPLAASILVEEGAIRRATALLVFGALLGAIGAARLDAIGRILFFRPLAYLAGVAALAVGIAYLSYALARQGYVSDTAVRVIIIGAVAIAMGALASRVNHGRLLLLANLLLVAVQFAAVVRDYHGEYMSRLAPWLQGNIRGAVVAMIDEAASHPGTPVYVTSFRNGQGYWDLRNRYVQSYFRFYASKLGHDELLSRPVFMTEEDSAESIPAGSVVLGVGEDQNIRRMMEAGATKITDIDEFDRPSVFTLLRK